SRSPAASRRPSKSRPSASAEAWPATGRSSCSRTCSGSPRGCRNSSSAMASSVPRSRPRLRPTPRTFAPAPSPAPITSIRSGKSRSSLVPQRVEGNGRDPALPCLCHIDRLIRLAPVGACERGVGGDVVSDIFHEVDEEVRREQLKKLWDRYGNYAIAAAVLLLAAVAAGRGYMWWEGKKAAESGAAFEAASTLAETGKRSEAEAAFAKIAVDGTSGYRHLARMREAAELAQTDAKAAIAAYDQIAADGAVGPALAGLGGVRRGRAPHGRGFLRGGAPAPGAARGE